MIKDYSFENRIMEIASLDIEEVTDIPNEPTFLINLNSREVKVPSDFKELAVYMDHKAETVWFSVNRYFDGKDLNDTTRAVQVTNAERNLLLPITYYSIISKAESPNGVDTLLLGWEITSDITELIGSSKLQVRFYQLNEDKTLKYNLSTKPFTVTIATGNYITNETDNIDPAPTTLNELVARIEDLYQNASLTNFRYENINKDTLPKINGVKLYGGDTHKGYSLGDYDANQAVYPDTSVIPLSYENLENLPTLNGEKFIGDIELKTETANNITINSTDTNPAEAQAVDKYVTNRLTAYNDIVNNLIDAKLGELTFTPISILSFVVNEVQTLYTDLISTINSLTFKWELNKEAKNAYVESKDSDLIARAGMTAAELAAKSKTLDNLSLQEDVNITLWVNDGQTEATSEVSIKFVPKIYYGAAAAPESYNAAFIEDFNFELRADRFTSMTINAGADEFIYIAIPQSYGAAAFNVGGFDGGFDSAVEVTGLYDGDVAYNLYKSTNANLGNTLVKVL